MKRLVITINKLGVGGAGFGCVDINIWQGKRLLISEEASGKWLGEFARVYDIDYDQEHPELLRLESNAPLGVSIQLSIESNECECEKELNPQIAEPTVASLAKEIQLLKSTVAHQMTQILAAQSPQRSSTNMKVTIENCGKIIWYRDEEKQEGIASVGYIKDGTQEKIIAALESALKQAKGELSCWNN